MEFGDNNMLGVNNNHTKERNGNTSSNININNINNNNTSNTFVNVWYSSWEPSIATTTSFSSYGGEGCHVQADPHLTCLHLGKRHYLEGEGGVGATALGRRHVCGSGGDGGGLGNDKRARGCGKTAPFGMVPRCQVEGCHVALVNAKEYHRRHRVCDMHSKAPKVVVLGLEQRFCQQCSRFHVVSEFDDSKRSCRRRLAGHNERRRKSSHLSVTTNSRQGCALSLLSSSGSESWVAHADLSTRCSAALRELIAENRATALMTRQVVYDRPCHAMPHHAIVEQQQQHYFQQIQPESNYFPQHMFPQTQ
ncbi:hypothetical protein Fmac_028929 [Flemingia macrophylla]|uniref:SBP-type domain-containing protein n=1 Tax=Flemingia macrophylla TaxID=520843 RepID=A0ABD1L8X3_9FABA